mgnify:CR=1 FL=1
MSTDAQHEWLKTPLGVYLQLQEQALFDSAVSDVFGFNAVQIGMTAMNLLGNSRMPFSFKAGNCEGATLCDSRHLPFLSNCIDLLLLPHALEFSHDPHQTLREAERVLVPEGHIMLTGFNPISAWGLKRGLTKDDGYPWNGSFLPLLRIKDWLALLGFEMVAGRMACYAPPFASPTWRRKFEFMDKAGDRWWPMMGGVYFVAAKKRVLGMRVIRPNWKKSKLKSSLISVPSQRQPSQKNDSFSNE